jgi:hypothetical protein
MVVDEYLASIETGVESPYELAVVKANPASDHPGTWSFGGGTFSVQLANGRYVRAHLRKLLQGRGKFHHNPAVATAARDGSHVLVEDLGLGGRMTHQIMAVMSPDQAARVHMMRGYVAAKRSSSGRSSNSRGWEFNRAANAYTNAAVRREALVKEAAGMRTVAVASGSTSPI